MTHSLYGSDNIFDSWMTACEVTMAIAEKEAQRLLTEDMLHLAHGIADDMILTAEEIETDE